MICWKNIKQYFISLVSKSASNRNQRNPSCASIFKSGSQMALLSTLIFQKMLLTKNNLNYCYQMKNQNQNKRENWNMILKELNQLPKTFYSWCGMESPADKKRQSVGPIEALTRNNFFWRVEYPILFWIWYFRIS